MVDVGEAVDDVPVGFIGEGAGWAGEGVGEEEVKGVVVGGLLG